MPYFERHFTVAEANALLPELRHLFTQIHELWADLPEADEAAQPVLQAAGTNGGGSASRYLNLQRDLEQLIGRIQERGILVKDLERGLVDFPHWRADQEVFLCWELSEEEVGYWHPLETGYAGRRRV
jgi:hypothetical protein